MNVRGIYLCFVCLKEKKIKYQNIRYQSYKYQSIKIIYDQIVNQLPFHVTFFTACILCYSDVLWIFFTETFQSSDFKVSWEICTLLWWRRRRRKLFKCSASAQPDLRWKSDDWDRNGQRYSHSEDHSSGVVKGGDGPRHVWHAHGDNKLEVEN